MVHRPIFFVTTFSAKGYEAYGKKMVESFTAHGVGDLTVYSEDALPPLPKSVAFRDANAIPGFQEFIKRHKDNPEANGRVPHPSWRKHERERGVSFRTDAFKFFRKPLVIDHYSERLVEEHDECRLVWLDGDIEVIGKPPQAWWDFTLQKGGEVCYLGRRGYHSECGFLLFQLPIARHFINDWAAWYRTDLFLGQESHDSKLFDVTRMNWKPPLEFRSISFPGRDNGHVFSKSMLKHFFIHNKGVAKYATDREMVVSRRGTAAAR